jgi:hypothetical protein
MFTHGALGLECMGIREFGGFYFGFELKSLEKGGVRDNGL